MEATRTKAPIAQKQLPIDEESKSNLLEIRRRLFYDTVDSLSEQMYTGQISLGQFQERFKSEVRQLYNSSAAIGKGGWDQMGPRDWGRLGTPLREQYQYLNGFVNYIDENREEVSLKYIQARARMYGDSAGFVAAQAEAGFWFEDALPWIPRDGQSECLVRCRCRWDLVITNRTKRHQIVRATWRLGVAEHCDTCVGRNGHTVILQVPLDVEVPPTIRGH